MRFLSLSGAQILHSRGWGTMPASGQMLHVEFADEGQLAVYRNGFFGEKKLLWTWIDLVQLKIWTDSLSSGGGFVGGGFGLEGAAEGMLAASVLNALTSRRHELAILSVVVTDWDGTVRELVFGWRALSESDLRRQVGEALGPWAASYCTSAAASLRKTRPSSDDALSMHARLDVVQERGLVTSDQLEIVRAELDFSVARPAAPAPPPAEGVSGPDRIELLKALVELRECGALTTAEFEAEKARVLAA